MNDDEMKYGDDYKSIPATSKKSGKGSEVVDDLFCYTVQIVNVIFVGNPETGDFVLVDAGTPGSENEIIEAAEERFGANSRPKAIILTHGHFDHVGSVLELIKYWKVPVYAHPMEFPFLTGFKKYPEPDPGVKGGMMAKLSSLYPIEAVNLGGNLEEIPSDGSVPYLQDFQWIHTPGHTPGHISLFREDDRSLIAGDAFVTVKQESLYKVMTQKKEISGPPRYLTPDWQAAKESVKRLQSLEPEHAVTGHGVPMGGKELRENLAKLADNFDSIAVPEEGKYVDG
ncbi:MAG: MBL fold metallo-hydrolase [Balneolaceae bacterium]